eukprot:14561309-Alexandrium_andersonii.AAC.1
MWRNETRTTRPLTPHAAGTQMSRSLVMHTLRGATHHSRPHFAGGTHLQYIRRGGKLGAGQGL